MARQRYCPRLTRYRNTLRVSADPVAKPAAQTRAESRVLDLRKLLRERDRLSAGGRWIRTSGSWSRAVKPVMRDCLENRSESVGEPKVRIHLPPAVSLVRTGPGQPAARTTLGKNVAPESAPCTRFGLAGVFSATAFLTTSQCNPAPPVPEPPLEVENFGCGLSPTLGRASGVSSAG